VAIIKSQLKRIKTNEKARQRNKATKSALKTSIRRFRDAADSGDTPPASWRTPPPVPRQGCLEGDHS
jgi:small subunit ribosomal protein S20